MSTKDEASDETVYDTCGWCASGVHKRCTGKCACEDRGHNMSTKGGAAAESPDYEYTTTYGEHNYDYDLSQQSPSDPIPPEGKVWCMCGSVVHLKFFYWFWKRKIQAADRPLNAEKTRT